MEVQLELFDGQIIPLDPYITKNSLTISRLCEDVECDEDLIIPVPFNLEEAESDLILYDFFQVECEDNDECVETVGIKLIRQAASDPSLQLLDREWRIIQINPRLLSLAMYYKLVELDLDELRIPSYLNNFRSSTGTGPVRDPVAVQLLIGASYGYRRSRRLGEYIIQGLVEMLQLGYDVELINLVVPRSISSYHILNAIPQIEEQIDLYIGGLKLEDHSVLILDTLDKMTEYSIKTGYRTHELICENLSDRGYRYTIAMTYDQLIKYDGLSYMGILPKRFDISGASGSAIPSREVFIQLVQADVEPTYLSALIRRDLKRGSTTLYQVAVELGVHLIVTYSPSYHVGWDGLQEVQDLDTTVLDQLIDLDRGNIELIIGDNRSDAVATEMGLIHWILSREENTRWASRVLDIDTYKDYLQELYAHRHGYGDQWKTWLRLAKPEFLSYLITIIDPEDLQFDLAQIQPRGDQQAYLRLGSSEALMRKIVINNAINDYLVERTTGQFYAYVLLSCEQLVNNVVISQILRDKQNGLMIELYLNLVDLTVEQAELLNDYPYTIELIAHVANLQELRNVSPYIDDITSQWYESECVKLK